MYYYLINDGKSQRSYSFTISSIEVYLKEPVSNFDISKSV